MRAFHEESCDKARRVTLQETMMAKGQKKTNKEVRKPKKAAVKVETVQASYGRSQQATLDNIKKS